MTFPKQQTSFLKIYKELDTLVPFQILKLALMWAIFLGIQELFQKGFDCPCIHTSNHRYGLMFLFLPGFTFIVVSLLLLKFNSCSWTGCKEFCQMERKCKICPCLCCKWFWQLVARAVFPGLMWVTVVLLDGDAVACIATSSEFLNLSDILCKFKTNKPLSTDQEQFVRCQLYVSQIIGLVMLLVMPGLALVIKSCQSCGLCKPITFWGDDLKQEYKEQAQQKIVKLAVSIPRKKYREEVTKKIETALNGSRETYWTVINDLCKDINLPTGDDTADPQPSTSGEPPATQSTTAASVEESPQTIRPCLQAVRDLFSKCCSCCCKGRNAPVTSVVVGGENRPTSQSGGDTGGHKDSNTSISSSTPLIPGRG